ncbi:fimbrial protein, partial [Providencia alcalifaciens]|uniref:fimbrial protein n=1 Tax=Providencia alcalifaciens TaxID=126385 RepID=UPI002AA0D93E
NIDIPITLSCAAGTNIKVNVTSDAIDNASTGKLSLTGPNKATGIAVQLLNNTSNPITLNTQWTQQDNVPEGDYIFGWKARYIKTSNTVTPGTANTTATVNIRYE